MPFQPILRFIILAVTAYAAYALLLFLMQRQILYPGRYLRPSGPPPTGIVTIAVITSAGRNEAWFMPPLKRKKGERRPLVIFFHGNGELIDHLPEQAEGFRELGMGVLLVEYPGFGRSSGQPDEKSITETAVAAFDAVLKREEVDPERVVLFGRSLGGGAACAVAARRPSAALILQSAFSSTRPFARNYLLPAFLVRDVFDNGRVLAAYRPPVLLFHGSRDSTVPPEHSRLLNRLAPHARLVEFHAGHNDFPPDWGEFYRIIAVFLREAGVVQPPGGGYSTSVERSHPSTS
ncbi:MAG: alpha/beta hydrolase [Steroidobacteraceae bacterium]|nr:alpha/beta hydrolase [Deltaproteobacteria bacterium]